MYERITRGMKYERFVSTTIGIEYIHVYKHKQQPEREEWIHFKISK